METEMENSKLKPVTHQLPDFILSSNRSTPLKISSHEILSSKKSSQLIQRLQDDFIKNNKHARNPGIDFSSYRLSAKKPRLESDTNEDDTSNDKAFSDDQYEDNPFMPSTSQSLKKKQLSIIIDDESEPPTEPEPISISETDSEQPPKSNTNTNIHATTTSTTTNTTTNTTNTTTNTTINATTNTTIEITKANTTITTNSLTNTNTVTNTNINDLLHTPKQNKTPKKDEHLESIKKKLSEHSLYVKELKEGIKNKLNKSKITSQKPMDVDKKSEESITIIESKESTYSSSSSSSPFKSPLHDIIEKEKEEIRNVSRSPRSKVISDMESSEDSSSTNTVSKSNNDNDKAMDADASNKTVEDDVDVEVIEKTPEDSEQYSLFNQKRNTNRNESKSSPSKGNGNPPENEDTPIDFDKISLFHRSTLENRSNEMMMDKPLDVITIDSHQTTENSSNAHTADDDNATEGTSNDQREVISIEDSASSNSESDKEVISSQNGNQEDSTLEVTSTDDSKVMIIEEDSEDHEDHDLYIIQLDKSPNKQPLTHTPSSTHRTPNKTPSQSGGGHFLQVKDDSYAYDNSPLSKKSSMLSHRPPIQADTSFGENEIIKMDKSFVSEMDIDIISVGDSSNSSRSGSSDSGSGGEGRDEDMKSRETTPEVDASLSQVDMNSSEDDNTILFSSGNTTPVNVKLSGNIGNKKEIGRENVTPIKKRY